VVTVGLTGNRRFRAILSPSIVSLPLRPNKFASHDANFDDISHLV
jgi:hypothetical protein